MLSRTIFSSRQSQRHSLVEHASLPTQSSLSKRLLSHLPIAYLVAAICGTAFSPAAVASEETAAIRSQVEQWVETRRILSAEEAQWQQEKIVLQDMIRVLDQENHRLADQISAISQGLSTADEQRVSLVERRDQLMSQTQYLLQQLRPAQQQLRAFSQQLPPPLLEEITPLLQRIPTTAAGESAATPAERLQAIVAILQAIEVFDRQLHVTPALTRTDDGQTREVTHIYLGLGAGWFVDASGTYAGRLQPTADGWQAETAVELAPALLQLLEIHANPTRASFIALPLSGAQPFSMDLPQP